MNRNTILTSLTAAALAGLFLTGNVSENVKADVKPDGETTKAKTAEENAQANVDSAQKDVDNAQQEVNTAKADLDSAQSNAAGPDSAYSDQQAKTDTAKKTELDKKYALDKVNDEQKQAEALNTEAKTPGAIDKASQAIENQNKDLSQKQQAVTDAQKQIPEKQQAVDSAQQDVNAKNSDLIEKQNAKATADQHVQDAQDALKGTGINETKEALDKAKTTVKDDQTNLANAKSAVADYTKQQGQIQHQQTEIGAKDEQAQRKVGQKQRTYDSAKGDYQQAQDNVISQQNQIAKLNNQLDLIKELSKNSIVIPNMDKFRKAYRDYVNTKELTQDDIDYVNSARAQNSFVSSDADKDDIVQTNNLTDKQLTELSLFTADLLSKLRGQLGWSQDQVTKGSLQMAKDVAANYLRDNWTGSWHDGNAVNDASEKNGLISVTDDSRSTEQYYEDESSSSEDIPSISMNDLKERVYNAVLDMIFPDGNGYDSPDETTSKYEMGHTAGLLGADQESAELKDSNSDTLEKFEELKNHLNEVGGYGIEGNGISYYIVINGDSIDNEYSINDKSYTRDEFLNIVNQKIATLKNGQYVAAITTNIPDADEPFGIHFVNIGPADIDSPQKFDDTHIPTYADQKASLTKQIDTLSTELEGLKVTAGKKQAALKQTDNDLRNAKDEERGYADQLSDLGTKLQGVAKKLSEANRNVDKYSQLLNPNVAGSDQAKANELQHRYDILTASNEEKTNNLNKALAAQTEAQTNLTNAQNALRSAQTKLNQAKTAQDDLNKDIATKQDAVKDAQNKLGQLKQHLLDLKNAPQILAQANDAQAKAQKEYDAAKKAADEAQAQLNKLESAKSSADAQVSAAQAEYDAALAKLKAAEDKLANAKNSLEKIKQSESLIDRSSNGATETSSEFKRIRLTHNAYVYTKALKVVKHKTHKNVLLKKNHYIKAWNKGKIVTIKGKKFYQIGKNRFVKVANTVTKKAKKSYVLAVVKGRKNHKVRVYLENGKFAKKYVYGQKTYKLAEKKTIKGKTYYRIYGKKLWVRANKIDLKK